jgi:SNF2 family DNA or RNA helicase
MRITNDVIQKNCSSTIYKRGLEYFKQGRVHMRRRDEDVISAVVDGEDVYHVQIKFKEDEISDILCTCPYYQTMQCACKHIVATLKQRQAELSEGDSFVDENDHIASNLCKEFDTMYTERERLAVRFYLNVRRKNDASFEYGMSIQAGRSAPLPLPSVEQFLDAYAFRSSCRISKTLTFSAQHYCFGERETQILDILSEAYQNRVSQSPFYTKNARETSFGWHTAKRLFPLLEGVDFQLAVDSVTCTNLQVRHENPDIVIDVSAIAKEITLSIGDAGLSLIPDGSWFLYEGDLYHTRPGWRKWFLPIYQALTQDDRTQIGFKGENTIQFAAAILPHLRNKQGIVMQGVDDMVVDQRPSFSIYFDRTEYGISAVIQARYGSLSLRLPSSHSRDGEKVILRDFDAEQIILDHFDSFTCENNTFYLEDEDEIYDFITTILPRLSAIASVYPSTAFDQIQVTDELDLKTRVHFSEKTNLLEADFETDLSFEQLRDILRAVRLKKRYCRLPDGSFLTLGQNQTLCSLNLLENLDFSEEDLEEGHKTLPIYQALYLSSLSQTHPEQILLEDSFTSFLQRIQSAKAVIPKNLEGILRKYQIDGIHWLKQLSALGFGGILADDMGLGKTLQVIAFVCGEAKSEPALIVTPSSLTYNWKSEIERFMSRHASSLIIDGSKEDRIELLKHANEYDFIITSYPLLRRDIALYDGLHFSYCFIDEAQHIKNPKTMNARSVKRIHADCRFALTGTPIENSLTELWSIFDFVMPGYLYRHTDFLSRFEHPIMHSDDMQAMEDLKTRIRPFLLRRMKKDVLSELPEKIENTMLSDLTPEQKKLYQAYLQAAKSEAYSILTGENSGGGRMRILALLTRLRQICCHPKLFDADYKSGSGKLLLLEELLTGAIDAGHRVLIFSQFTSMLSIIQERLDALSISSFYLDGSTPPEVRTQMADRFNAGEKSVFLISLKAGGTGLNLTGADMVIHYDPWWNPAVMDQASDRAYRIGQTRAVQIIRLAARGTLEERIIEMQKKKRFLADGVITANQTSFGKLSKEEIMALFE